MASKRTLGSRRGNNLIEFTFLLPWYVFLFVGSFDLGLYSYGLIAVQSAARIGAMHCAASSATAADATAACTLAIGSLKALPNIGSAVTTCSASPLVVTATAVSGPDGGSATQVVVTWTPPSLPGIPNLIPSGYVVTRTITMRLRS